VFAGPPFGDDARVAFEEIERCVPTSSKPRRSRGAGASPTVGADIEGVSRAIRRWMTPPPPSCATEPTRRAWHLA
jgi:hypothetical protein